MASFTSPGTINQTLLKNRDDRLGISTEAKRELRAGYLPNFEKGEVAEGCDVGEKTGRGIRFIAEESEVKV